MSVTQSGPYCTMQWEVNLKPSICGTMFVTLIPSVSALSPCVGSSVGCCLAQPLMAQTFPQ